MLSLELRAAFLLKSTFHCLSLYCVCFKSFLLNQSQMISLIKDSSVNALRFVLRSDMEERSCLRVILDPLCFITVWGHVSHLSWDHASHPLSSYRRQKELPRFLGWHSVGALHWISSHHASSDESLLEGPNLSPYCPIGEGSHYLSVTPEGLAGLFKQMLMDAL